MKLDIKKLLKCTPFVLNKHDHSLSECLDIIEMLAHHAINDKFYQSTGKDRSIVNLSSHQLSENEEFVLSKGLNFCPTPKPVDTGELNIDLERFFRSSTLALMYNVENSHKKPINQVQNTTENVELRADDSQPNILPSASCMEFSSENPPFSHPELKTKSTMKPNAPSHLDYVCNLIQSDVLTEGSSPKKVMGNLNKSQYRAISELRNNRDIIIKKADKGSNIVIMNRCDYVKEGLRQLNNSEFYCKTDNDLTEEHKIKVVEYVDSLYESGQISKQTRKYLTTNCGRTPQFYLLPKIHKSITDPPGRPIVSSNDSPTEKISHLVEVILKPLVPKIRSYIKDTTDFIQKIENIELRPGTVLVTLDVTSLYTNIPHIEGVKAVSEFLSVHRDSTLLPHNNIIVNLTRMVLTHNNFDFNGEHYLQISGTAMGTRLAPSYANIFMDHFERTHVYPYTHQPDFWGRYIDDCKMLWSLGSEKLNLFLSRLNSCHQSIKFTVNSSNRMVPFLDTRVYLLPNWTLGVTVHEKETDTHSYLMFDSDHPLHVKEAIPYSQFLRVRRICTHWLDFLHYSFTLASHFLRRGYPRSIVLEALLKAHENQRSKLLEKPKDSQQLQNTQQEKDKEIFFVYTHNRSNPPIPTIVKKHWDLLGRSVSTRPLLDFKITFSLRRPPNLKDLICRSKLQPIDRPKTRPTCKSPNTCVYCPRINTTGIYTHHITGKIYRTMVNVCCQSTNLVYLLECPTCGILYVGQTKNTLLTRTYQHKYAIRKNDPLSTVARHFNAHNIENIPSPLMHVLEFIKLPPNTNEAWQLRLKREKVWIFRLNTLIPAGLNLME